VKAFILILALFFSACTPSLIDRTTLSENLELVLGLEDQIELIKQRVSRIYDFGYLSEELAAEFKLHNDIYYPYYVSANYFLATNQLELYRNAVALAQAELTAMNVLITNSTPHPIPDYRPLQSLPLKVF